MLERHAEELDTLRANYNLAVEKLASEHNKKTVKAKTIKSKVAPITKGVLCVQPEENVIH